MDIKQYNTRFCKTIRYGTNELETYRISTCFNIGKLFEIMIKAIGKIIIMPCNR